MWDIYKKKDSLALWFIISVQKQNYVTPNVNKKICFTPELVMVVEMEVRQAAVETVMCSCSAVLLVFLPCLQCLFLQLLSVQSWLCQHPLTSDDSQCHHHELQPPPPFAPPPSHVRFFPPPPLPPLPEYCCCCHLFSFLPVSPHILPLRGFRGGADCFLVLPADAPADRSADWQWHQMMERQKERRGGGVTMWCE